MLNVNSRMLLRSYMNIFKHGSVHSIMDRALISNIASNNNCSDQNDKVKFIGT